MTKHILIIIVVVLLSSCSKQSYNGISVKNWKANFEEKSVTLSFEEFSGSTFRAINLEDKSDINLVYNTSLENGSIKLIVLDKDENKVWESSNIKSIENKNTLLKLNQKGNLKMVIKGNNATGSLKVNWDI
ncbi:MAG: hypothetical protein ACPGUU_04790 [Flavobacteriaceae bacterium]